MRYALNSLITSIISALEVDLPVLAFNGETVKVYTAVGIDNLLNDGTPVVVVTPVGSTEDNVNKDDLSHEYSVEVMVATKYSVGLGGWGNNNGMIDQILAKLRPNVNIELDLTADNFKVVEQRMEAITPEVESSKENVLYTTTITFTFLIQDLAS